MKKKMVFVLSILAIALVASLIDTIIGINFHTLKVPFWAEITHKVIYAVGGIAILSATETRRKK